MIDDYPLLTLLPPVLAIGLAVTTRKVLLSLGLGVLSAAVLVADLDPVDTLGELWSAFAQVFWVDGALNTTYVYILVFTLALGVITAFVSMSGGTRAFADWAHDRIRTRRGAIALPAALGGAIFIDDYFNALTVGQVSRPITDRHRVSRAKLTYLVDSTSAPVAVLMPFSSWGAYILGIFTPIVAASALTVSDLGAYVRAAAANYYAWAALLMVVLVVAFNVDLGPMRREERRALEEGKTFEPGDDIPGQLSEDLPVHRPGAKRALVVPFVLLVLGVLVGIVWSGVTAAGSAAPLDVLAEADVTWSLLVGAFPGLAAALYYYSRDTASNPRFSRATFGRGWWEGLRSMWPAVSILLLAWMLGSLIGSLGTGEYLGGLVEDSSLPTEWLVPVVFLVALAMAFATGTSWGSFGLLLPIAGGIVNAVDAPELLLPVLGAVLAGAVAGDHASPISDTTILSSTGSGCNVITHVTTQLPYVVVAVLSATAGYCALALTGSTTVGFVATMLIGTGVLLGARRLAPPLDALPDPDRDSQAVSA